MSLTYGSLCSGYEGIGLGLSELFDLDHRWHFEVDPHASEILEARFPCVPNLGDLTAVDWRTVEPVEVASAGYPCQPFSHAGKRKGTDDERHLWPHIARAVGVLRPRLLVLENVAGHLSLGFDVVLGDLAALGYDLTWSVVRAADVGAPHPRKRLFIVATDTRRERHGRHEDTGAVGRLDRTDEGAARERERARSLASDRGAAAAPVTASEQVGSARLARSCAGLPVANTASDGRHEGRTESAGVIRRPDVAVSGDAVSDANRIGLQSVGRVESERRDLDGRDRADIAWGDYEPAIRRWERTLGRPAPHPTEPGPNGERLAAHFVEWMMGLPAGWVTDVDIPRNAQLKALGNGVVPQQCAAAASALLDRAAVVA